MKKPSKSTLSALRVMADGADIRISDDCILVVLKNGEMPIYNAKADSKKSANRWLDRYFPGIPRDTVLFLPDRIIWPNKVLWEI